MKQKVNPVVAIVICLIAAAVVGMLSMKVFAPNTGEDTKVVVPKPNMNDPHFKPDPKLSGGG